MGLRDAFEKEPPTREQIEAARQRNRERMPQVAAFVDECRECFGEVRVEYAQENGYEVGHVK